MRVALQGISANVETTFVISLLGTIQKRHVFIMSSTSPDVAGMRNFGLSFAQTEPRGRAKVRIMVRALACMRREIGLVDVLRVLARSRRLERGIDRGVVSAIRDQGLRDERFLSTRLEETALVAAMVEILGLERAREAYQQILEAVADDVMLALIPTAEELQAFDDPFAAFHAYLAGVLRANASAAIHLTEVREDTTDVFAYDVTYCVYERVAAAFGDPALCDISSCAGDDVSFPRLCGQIGARFRRRSTLAAGAACCDFRFERLPAS